MMSGTNNEKKAWPWWMGLLRATWHVLGCLGAWALVEFMQPPKMVMGMILSAVVLIFGWGETARLLEVYGKGAERTKSFIKWTKKLLCVLRPLQKLIMAGEEKKLNSSLLMMFGFALVLLLAPPWIIAYALLLTATDPFGKLGKFMPMHRIRNGLAEQKSVGGFVFIFAAAILFIAFFMEVDATTYPSLLPMGLGPVERPLIVCLTGAVASSLFELFGGRNDNLLMPAGSAIVMVLVDHAGFG